MLKKKLRLTLLALLVLAPFGASHAAEMATYCRLQGGSLVPLPAAACATEGGTMVSAELAPAAEAGPAVSPVPATASAPASAAEIAAAIKPTGNPDLDQAEKQVVDILDRPVGAAPSNKKTESIERTAKFDGCQLAVEEQMHIDFGNILTSRKNFKIDSAVNFRKLARESFSLLGEVSSRAGDLSGQAVSFEEPKRDSGNSISISVLIGIRGSYAKYSTDGESATGQSASLSGPQDYYWIVDRYGYALDIINSVQDIPATDTIRILYILNTPDDAAHLMSALDKISAMCRS